MDRARLNEKVKFDLKECWELDGVEGKMVRGVFGLV